jgi:tetratricopeptide (TPR) repeat protein
MARRWLVIAALAGLLAAVVWLQIVRDAMPPLPQPAEAASMMYLRSPAAARRAALSYDGLAADVYWIRAIQHYGSTKLSTSANKRYDQLYPLLDLTTSLDPRFDIAYRFGAIFLSEPPPNGPGRPDLAVALLRKGLEAQPDEWQFAQDIGFVYYWWLGDYKQAAEWFGRAGSMPGAADWLRPLAALTLAQGGNRASSRKLWQEIHDQAEHDWLRNQAETRLLQFDAMDQIDALLRAAADFERRSGMPPRSWEDLMRAGYLRQPPADPAGHVYVIDAERGAITLGPLSPLNPLPTEPLTIDRVPVAR